MTVGSEDQSMADNSTLSFARDIRPMFTDLDIAHMKPMGMDLSDRASVESHGAAISSVVSDGSMPPPGTGEKWTTEMCERFKNWLDQGCPP
jgi:hypothetical protein